MTDQVNGEAVKDYGPSGRASEAADSAEDSRVAVTDAPRLTIVPVKLAESNAYIERHHRHSIPVEARRHLFSLGAALGDEIVGVAIVARPSARALDNGITAEVARVCSTGTRNVCSFLYGACWQAARKLGYLKLVTYTLKSESGSSLKASGWRTVAEVKGRSWNGMTRPRVDKFPIQDRLRWEKEVVTATRATDQQGNTPATHGAKPNKPNPAATQSTPKGEQPA